MNKALTIKIWRFNIEIGWYSGEPLKLIGIDLLSHEDLSDLNMSFVTIFSFHVLRFSATFYINLGRLDA